MSRVPDFDWTDDSCVLFRKQPATAVYSNPYAAVVIRQEGDDLLGDDDPFVTLDPNKIPTLCIALLQEAGHERLAEVLIAASGDGKEVAALPLTGAERTRRYRQSLKGREPTSSQTVTDHQSVTESVTASVTRSVSRRAESDATRDGSQLLPALAGRS